MNAIEHRVIGLVQSLAPRHIKANVTLDSKFEEDLGITSLDLLRLIASAEKCFELNMLRVAQTADFASVSTVRGFAAVIAVYSELPEYRKR